MLTELSLANYVGSLSRPNLSRGLLPSTSKWFLNAGIMVRSESQPGARKIEGESVFGLTYIYSGSGKYEDDEGNSINLKTRQVFVRAPNRIIKITPSPTEKWVGIFFSFPEPYWTAMRKTFSNIPDTIAWDVNLPLDLIEENLAIQKLLEKGDEISRFEALSRMQTLTIRYFRRKDSIPSKSKDTIEKLHTELSNLRNAETPIPDIIASSGIGYESFRKKFRSRYGESPAAYRNRIRIEQACRLLSNTEYTISQISGKLLYSDVFVFSRQFKIVMKCSPSYYRKRFGTFKTPLEFSGH